MFLVLSGVLALTVNVMLPTVFRDGVTEPIIDVFVADNVPILSVRLVPFVAPLIVTDALIAYALFESVVEFNSYEVDILDDDIMDALPKAQQDQYIEKQIKPQIEEQLKLSQYIENYPSLSKVVIFALQKIVNELKELKKDDDEPIDIQDHPMVKMYLDKLEDLI